MPNSDYWEWRDLVVKRAPRGRVPRRLALVVGVGSFDAEGVEPIPCAEADAAAVYQTLVDPDCGLFRPEDVQLLTGERASSSAVKTAFAGLVDEECAAADLVLVYFATHGISCERGAGRSRSYLLFHDSDPRQLLQTALAMSELSAWLSDINAPRVVVVLDTCHAGSSLPGAGGQAMSLRELEHLRAERAVLAACRAGQRAAESDRDGHGLFSKHLLRGLRGAADAHGRGSVGAMELFSYVHHHVRAEARAHGYEQDPVWWGEVSRGTVLSRNPLGKRPVPGRLWRGHVPRIVVEGPDGPRMSVALLAERILLGRHPDCDVQLLSDPTVSRDHALLSQGVDGWRLENHAPLERTKVNGELLFEGARILVDGDVLTLGETRLRFLHPAASAPLAPGAGSERPGNLAEVELQEPSRPLDPTPLAQTRRFPALSRQLDERPGLTGGLPLLVRGEPGSELERVARLVHARGPRSQAPFVRATCEYLPERLIYGDANGPGIFEKAQGGTLFLDHLELATDELQRRLIGILDEQRVRRLEAPADEPGLSLDLRVVAGTYADPQELAREGRLRWELVARLGVVSLKLLPLGERLDDLPWLVDELARSMAPEGKAALRFESEAITALFDYSWPGNEGELRELLEALQEQGCTLVREEDLPWCTLDFFDDPVQLYDLPSPLAEEAWLRAFPDAGPLAPPALEPKLIPRSPGEP